MLPDFTRNVGYIPLAALITIPILFGVFIKRRYYSSISDVPGPFLASFGTLWYLKQILKGEKGHTEEAVIKLHQQHGHFVRLTHKEVSVSHPEAVSKVLNAPLWKADNFYLMFACPNINYLTAMAHINPKHHAEYVKKIGPAYSMSNVIRSEPSIDSAIELLGDRLDKLAKDGTSTNLGQWFSFVAFDILGEVTFSKRMGFLNQGIDVGNSIANTYALSFYVVLMAYAQWLHAILLGNPILRWLDFMPNEHILTTAVENVHARKNSKDVRVDMMEQWMLMQEKMAGRMDDRQVLMAAVGNIGAGGETVAAEMQAFFYIMMRHPEHFSRLRVEIDQADERGELSRVVSLAESQKLPFLQACIKETLRMFPAFSWSLPRVAPEEGLTIGDRHFTKGTVLSVHPWVINRSVECFGPDAHVFNPCRWLDPVRSQKLDRYMISFGSGPNMCLGRNLAMLELSKILPTLVRDFEFTQVDQSKEWKFHTLVIAVPYGWPCYIQRRERAKQVSGEKAQYPG